MTYMNGLCLLLVCYLFRLWNNFPGLWRSDFCSILHRTALWLLCLFAHGKSELGQPALEFEYNLRGCWGAWGWGFCFN